MDMNIQKYMAFVRTVEHGSFTKAAEILNYSQSGISRMINDLEKEWKVILLERGKSGVKLTSDGMKLLAILPELILKRVLYRIVAKELDVPAYRKIGIALRSKKTASLAVRRFLEYLPYR